MLRSRGARRRRGGRAHRRVPVRDRGDERRLRASVSSATSWPSTRRGVPRTRAPAATARSSSAPSCAGPTSWASTWSRPATTCAASATTPAGICGVAPTRARTSPTCCTCSASTQLVAVAVPGGRPAEGRDQGARRAVRPAGGVEARLAGALLRAERRRRRVRAIAGSLARAPGGRGGRPRRACARGTRRHVRVHGRPAPRPRGRARLARLRARGRRTREPGGGRAPGAAQRAVGCAPTERRGSQASRPATGRSKPRCGFAPATKGRPPWSSPWAPTAFTVTFRSPQRVDRPRPERRDLPGRRGARRRPHRHDVPLAPPGRRPVGRGRYHRVPDRARPPSEAV